MAVFSFDDSEIVIPTVFDNSDSMNELYWAYRDMEDTLDGTNLVDPERKHYPDNGTYDLAFYQARKISDVVSELIIITRMIHEGIMEQIKQNKVKE